MLIIPRMDPEIQRRLRDDLAKLPAIRIRRKRLGESIVIDPELFAFCTKLSLDGVIGFIEWWYAAIALLFDRMQHDELVKDFSEDIFQNNPRLLVYLDREDNLYQIDVRIDHTGQSSVIPLGSAIVVRRAAELYEICATNVDWTQKMIRFLSGDLDAADEVLFPGEYEEIQVGRGRIIYTED